MGRPEIELSKIKPYYEREDRDFRATGSRPDYHPSLLKMRYLKQSLFFALLRASALIIALALGGILLFIILNGARAVNWTFLTQFPMEAMTRGYHAPAITGLFNLRRGHNGALPLGDVGRLPERDRSMVLSEESDRRNNLAGVPSVVSLVRPWVLRRLPAVGVHLSGATLAS